MDLSALHEHCVFMGTCLAKSLPPYRIGKRPHQQNRAKIHQKYTNIFDAYVAYFEGCCVFLSCRGQVFPKQCFGLTRRMLLDLGKTPKGHMVPFSCKYTAPLHPAPTFMEALFNEVQSGNSLVRRRSGSQHPSPDEKTLSIVELQLGWPISHHVMAKVFAFKAPDVM